MGNQIENITERLGQLQKSVQILVDIDNIEFSTNELSTDIVLNTERNSLTKWTLMKKLTRTMRTMTIKDKNTVMATTTT